MPELLLGIDVGTYSSKGVVVSLSGEVLKTRAVQHTVNFPRPGWAEQDAESVWWADVVHLCHTLLDGEPFMGADVAAVALSAMGPCLLALDARGSPLRPGILYGIDTRASSEIAWLNSQFGEEAIFETAGSSLTSQSVGPKILWLRRNEPDVWRQVDWVTTAGGYLSFKMTGMKTLDRRTASHFAPLFDIGKLEWSDQFARDIVDLDKLPRLAWSDEIAGRVTAAAAGATGLNVGTPVAVGGIDGLSEALSVGVVQPGDMMLMYGSTAFFNLVLDAPRPDPRTWLTGGAFPGTYTMTAGMATTGSITQWFADQLSHTDSREETYSGLFERAAQIEAGAAGLLMLPYFSGERSPIHDPFARGVIAGLTLAHTRAHIFRAILEGTAFGIRHNLETIRSTGAHIENIVAVGGGTQSSLWPQIVSDVTGFRQAVPAQTIGASFGNAFLAGVASGLLERSDLKTWVKPGRVVVPDEANRPLYDARYADFLDLYVSTRKVVHNLSRGSP